LAGARRIGREASLVNRFRNPSAQVRVHPVRL
jgi:hypothetical protein